METDGKKKRSRVKISVGYNKLVMFDFDDTLAKTEECTLVRDRDTDRIVNHLHGQYDFDNYELNEKKHYFDFSEFDTVSDFAEPIAPTINLMKKFINEPKCKIIILTARQQKSATSIKRFLRKHGIDTTKISVFGSDGAGNKKEYLSKLIKRYNIKKSVLVFEDSLSNITDLISLEYALPNLTFDFVQVIDSSNTDEDLEEAKKFQYPKGEYGTEKYQRILKKVHPAMKRRLIGLGGSDYLSVGSKKVKDFKRSKSAPPGG